MEYDIFDGILEQKKDIWEKLVKSGETMIFG